MMLQSSTSSEESASRSRATQAIRATFALALAIMSLVLVALQTRVGDSAGESSPQTAGVLLQARSWWVLQARARAQGESMMKSLSVLTTQPDRARPLARAEHSQPVHATAVLAADPGIPRLICRDRLQRYADLLADSPLYDMPFKAFGCGQDDCKCAMNKLETQPALCWPPTVPVWARQQEHYVKLATPDPTFYSCQWRSELGKSLASPVLCHPCLALVDAKRLSMKTAECVGITRQYNENDNLWTMRTGKTAVASDEYTDEQLESLVLLRGLCRCACSGNPPPCVWETKYDSRLGGQVSRSYTCVRYVQIQALD